MINKRIKVNVCVNIKCSKVRKCFVDKGFSWKNLWIFDEVSFGGFFETALYKVEIFLTYSLSHTAGYKNHSVEYVFHSVEYKTKL